MRDMRQVEEWGSIEGLRHGFTGRRSGVSRVYSPDGTGEWNLGLNAGDDPGAVKANRAAPLQQLGSDELAMVRQVHGTRVVRAFEGFGQGLVEADGMVTDEPGLVLAVQAADCVPVLVADPVRRAAGAFHAGWRGTAAGIVREGIAVMMREFGSKPEQMLVAVGPSIGPCCYAVGGELRQAFAESLFDERGGKTYLNLWEANRRQAVEMGVADVSIVGECTACFMAGEGRRYFSHRADAGRTGRGVGAIGWP